MPNEPKPERKGGFPVHVCDTQALTEGTQAKQQTPPENKQVAPPEKKS